MTQPMNPPRMIIRPDKELKSFIMAGKGNDATFSFHSCCDDPTPGHTRWHSANDAENIIMTGWTIYCENCDTTLLSMIWNVYDMADYSGEKAMKKADKADAYNRQLEYHTINHQHGTKMADCRSPFCRDAAKSMEK